MHERVIRPSSPAFGIDGVEIFDDDGVGKSDTKLVILLVHQRQLYRDCLATSLSGFSQQIDVIPISDARHITTSHSSARVCILAIDTAVGPSSRFGADLAYLLTTLPKTPIIVLADEVAGVVDILRALNQGARGYLKADLELGIMIEAIRSVIRGGIFVISEPVVTSEDETALSIGFTYPAPRRRASHASLATNNPKLITQRESEVLTRLCQGKPNKIIAYELEMSPCTVRAHVQAMMRKVGAANRTELSFLMRPFVDHQLPELGEVGSEPV